MKELIEQLVAEARAAAQTAAAPKDLEALKIAYLGRKGKLSVLFERLKEVPSEERPEIGKRLNDAKRATGEFFDVRAKELASARKEKQSILDLTLPGIWPPVGRRHPVSSVMNAVCRVFTDMGYRVVEGPDIETEYYNFQALNIPLDHPSRDAFDTFYLALPSSPKGAFLLRSHTSPVQSRFMEEEKPPFKIVVPGRVFRPDATDASHSFMFHQVEGLVVGSDVTFTDLKGGLSMFARTMFGAHTKTRFRPHYFPFTEPSAEMDVSCILCKGEGCRMCKQTGWLEILGAGMVNPKVFAHAGYDPARVQGYAFGMGIERIALLKYAITDIRLLFENDTRFLTQF